MQAAAKPHLFQRGQKLTKTGAGNRTSRGVNLNSLKPEDKHFARLVVSTGNTMKSAMTAYGWAESTAQGDAHNKAKQPVISEYINKLRRMSETKEIATIHEIKKTWTHWMRDPEVEMSHRIKASELLAKNKGMFIERTEVVHTVNMVGSELASAVQALMDELQREGVSIPALADGAVVMDEDGRVISD